MKTLRLLLVVLTLSLLAAMPAAAQFTIPNNNSPSIINTDQSVWMQTDIDTLVAGVNGTGVLYGAAVTAQASPNMTLAVAAGAVKIGTTVANVTAGNVTITAADATNPRIDIVTVNTSGTKAVVAGTAASSPAPPALPANTVVLAMVYIPSNDTAIGSTQLVDKRVMLDNVDRADVDVRDYGAKCDGSTDDATAIQAAIHAALSMALSGTVRLPAGICAFGTTLVLGDDTGGTAATFVSIRGAGAASSGLKWIGSTSGVALKLVKNKYFRLQSFYVLNGVAKGTTIGISFSGYGGVGTETLGGVIDHLGVNGFNLGISAGTSSPAVASSDILYNYLELDNNDVGWANVDLNTLNHVFVDFNIVGNGTGMYAHVGNVFVRGGSSSGNNIDFDLNLDDFHLQDFRAEVFTGKKFIQSTGSRIVSIDHVLLSGSVDNTIDAYRSSGAAGGDQFIQISNCYFTGRITLAQVKFVQITNSFLNGDTAFPFFFTADTQHVRYDLRGNYNLNGGDDVFFPDLVGQQVGAQNGTTPSYQVNYRASSGTDGLPLFAMLQLRNVSMLAAGSSVDGKNLRMQIKFATSATASVTFKHTVTCSVSAGHCNVSAGATALSDIGRPATLTQGGFHEPVYIKAVNLGSQWLDWVDPTGASNTSAGPFSIAIGEDEPDADYLLMLGCDANETVRWSSKSTTGFTLTSSNASSTATCDVMVVR